MQNALFTYYCIIIYVDINSIAVSYKNAIKSAIPQKKVPAVGGEDLPFPFNCFLG
jgi:hypothetical protein